MRTLTDIRHELEDLAERRTELWEQLSEEHDPAKAAEAAKLSARIEALWDEARTARARQRFGEPERILARARAEDRLDRESRRLRRAA